MLALDDPLAPAREHRALLRIVEGVRGAVTVRLRVAPGFDYGEVTPWLRDHGRGVFTASGGDDGLLCLCDRGLESAGDGTLVAEATVRAGERLRLRLERELAHLRGYRGAGPVRVGNGAGARLQLDSYGHLLEQNWTWAQYGQPPDDQQWRFLLGLVEAAAEQWREPDTSASSLRSSTPARARRSGTSHRS